MDFSKGSWKPGKAFNVGDLSSLLDDKSANRIAADVKHAMPPRPKKSQEGSGILNPYVKASDYGKKGHAGYKAPKKAQSRGSSQDRDLMSTMMSRLTALEKVNRSLKKEIQEKSIRIENLEKENERLESSSNKDYYKKHLELEGERNRYKKQCEEMTVFLEDYGLKWVGNDSKDVEGKFDSDAIHKELAHQAPNYRNSLPSEIDTEILSRRIEELNFIAEKNKLVETDGAFKFKKHDEFPIWFFKNGLVLRGFPFYPYYSKEAQSVLSDILDGYFPYDLKKLYPEGVPLKPIDRVGEVYNPNEEKKEKQYKQVQDFDSEPVTSISKKEFLDRFPKNVIKNGKIIPIRDELEKKFKETKKLDLSKLNTNEPIEIETHVIESETDGVEYDKSEIVSLRIRTETGKRNLLLKLLVTDTMNIIYEYIQPYLEDGTSKVEIRSNFPRKTYEKEGAENLKQLGLFPSAALVIHKV
eukprot:CAMPEP_0196998096 /NCGR_PEP_ID=MMETSP1380-20130617/3562_1 /TAXON_ID=5936 /ORGANISM="Euplotes crassus, Strain CT5" /LENGTH=468 /DNA_ID=CAMNT_0042414541 /DNA_START=8 /DNA_END=1414 /DNA_ORIENTATION=+